MSAAAAVARKPVDREGRFGLPKCEAVFPPGFFRTHWGKFLPAEKDALLLISELQGEEWLRQDRRVPRDEVEVTVSPAQLATWDDACSRSMQYALRALSLTGAIGTKRAGIGKPSAYWIDWSRITRIQQADLEQARKRASEPDPEPAPAKPPKRKKLPCPLGQDCPHEIETRGELTVLIPAQPSGASKGVTPPTYATQFVGEQKVKASGSGNGNGQAARSPERQAMVDWLHEVALPAVGAALSQAMEEQFCKYASRCPSWVWQAPVLRVVARREERKLKYLTWTPILEDVVKAVTDWERQGKPGATAPTNGNGRHSGTACRGCGANTSASGGMDGYCWECVRDLRLAEASP